MKNIMKNLFHKYEINLNQSQIEKFENFLKIFQEKNSKINLSSLKNENEIIEKHFIDSLVLTKFINLKWNIADIWTWWGFPWIPLAIFYPKSNFLLIDSIWKKINAVNEFKTNLLLDNLEWIKSRFEEIWQNKKYREKFDFVVSRATAYLPTLLEYAIPLLKINWVFIAYKLDNKDEINESKNALNKLNSKIIDLKKYSLSWQERVFIFIKKMKETNKLFPRQNWIPLKKPIL